jgi:putative SOS response-associated peptidase YedK
MSYSSGMCGRYAIRRPPEALREHFGYAEKPNFPPRYNIAPTQPVPVVHETDGRRHFTLMRWGFVPGWVKDLKDFPLVINIRSETVREKASFRAAFIRRRALMPADGFYEWQRLGRESRPFLLRRPDRGVFAFAALWETWSTADGSEIDTVGLINTTANGVISAIHERSPVILQQEHFAQWLDPHTPLNEAYRLLQPPAEDLLEMVPVSKAVNRVANDGPEVQEPLDAGGLQISVPGRRVETKGDTQGSLF